MKTLHVIGALIVVGVIGAWLAGNPATVSAHHAFAAEFDAERPVEFTGTVTKVEWVNPHVWIHINVNLDAGGTEEWAFEAGTPNIADAIGLGFACDYLKNIGMENPEKQG